ncbi:hypothetical protein [Motilimonas sp. E26]|uniref:hypothetical protein n=1 Tax=Motilimonas sp. E26 TaxID=2865674 RepID=UPI001E61B1F6|nr:hypothetical protein [Motilimonas sp. E26]MCE0558579.1 hypothetical protein [Motilimonas sp. E26]
MKNRLFYFSFFSAFLPIVNAIGYLSVFKNIKFTDNLLFYFFIIYLSVVFLVNVLFFEPLMAISSVRFYFGFLIFYIVFKYSSYRFCSSHFLFLCFLVVLESVVINTVISPQLMPNFPDASAPSHFNIGGYQRPYSFAGNASVASLILVVLFTMLRFKLLNFLMLSLSVLVLSSGVGYLSFIFMIYCFIFVRVPLLTVFISLLLIFLGGIFINNFDLAFFSSKVSNAYINFLVEFKLGQIKDVFASFTYIDFIFGDVSNYSNIGLGGDFGWVYFFSGFGLVGSCLIVAFLINKSNKVNFMPLLIIFLFTWHYPAMFFLSGQVVLGYVLNCRKRGP